MFSNIIISLAAIFALYWTIQTRKFFPAIITTGMITAFIMTICPIEGIHTSGLHAYMGFAGLSFIYGIFVRNMQAWPKLIIIMMSASIFLFWLWVLNHWHGNTLLLPIFTLLVGLAAIITRAKLKNELGFLAILAADALALIIENLMKAN